MARPLRIEFEGAYYHILSRGNKQQAIFLSDIDRYTFLKTLERMSERFEVDILAFVLMDNHYHLLLQTNRSNLSRSMQWLGTTYTRIFNLHHSQSGHLFQGRFKSILVEDQSYLTQLSYYIHRNPLRAGIVKRLIDYPWSSYLTYAYNRRRPDWLKTDLILSQFGSDRTAQNRYREKVQHYADERNSIWEDISHGVVYGSKNFVDRIKKVYLSKDRTADNHDRNFSTEDLDLEDIIQSVSASLKIDIGKWKGSRRILKSDIIHRDMLVYYLWQSGRFNNSEIGNQVGLTISSVSRRAGIFQALLERDKETRTHFEKFKSIIKV